MNKDLQPGAVASAPIAASTMLGEGGWLISNCQNYFFMNYEKRTDCEFFEIKCNEHDCSDCQTDGHYLCAGCKHIAPFEEMELSDNRMGYYEKQEKASIEAEKLLSEEDDEVEFERCSNCD